MSTLAIKAPLPTVAIISATWSMEVYVSEHKSGSMPSLTLTPGGKDMSVIRHHFPG